MTGTIKKFLSQSLLAFFVVFVAFVTMVVTDATVFQDNAIAFAETDEDEDENEEGLEIEAEPYKSVDGKWKVEAEVDGEEIKFYVYDIDTDEELVEEIKDYVNNKFDLDLSNDEVADILKIEDEDGESEELEEGDLEIEAEPYKSIEGKWEVEAEMDGEETKFYVYNIDRDEELIAEITEYLNDKFDIDLAEDEVKEVIEIERDDEDENDKDKEKEKGYEKEKTDNGKGLALGKNLNIDLSTATKEEKEAFIEDLREMLMQLLMQLLQQVRGN